MTADEIEVVRSYLENHAPELVVDLIRRVRSENVLGRQHDVWDVRANGRRWWVITDPTQLYTQDRLPTAEVALSFHVGRCVRFSHADFQGMRAPSQAVLGDIGAAIDACQSCGARDLSSGEGDIAAIAGERNPVRCASCEWARGASDPHAPGDAIQEDRAARGAPASVVRAGDDDARPMDSIFELTIVMPCLNEAETIGTCIEKANQFLSERHIAGEVVIADNGSTDGSQEIVAALGARLVQVPARGYGAALIGGIKAARSHFVAMGDADDSYDFGSLMPFVEALRDGADLVMGNRFKGGIQKGAMPPLHRYLGNPVLSFLGRRFFGTPIGDFHCGLRAFRRDSILRLGLSSPGMEFASEMVVKATIAKLVIREVPTTLAPDGRSRAPHLRTWRDGWRHLRFLLIYAPKFLLLYPGLTLLGIGLLGVLGIMPGDLRVGDVKLGIDTMIFAAMAVIMGAQLVGLSAFAQRYGVIAGLWPENSLMHHLRGLLSVERVCAVGGGALALGIGGSGAATAIWASAGFGDMNPTALMRLTIPSVLLSCVGLQILVTAFLIGLLDQPISSVSADPEPTGEG